MSAIREVKQRIGIVELVSEYVALQKSGRNLKGLCPFHSEKHASFFVFPEQQTWHCFGACGTGGDVLSFVMKKEGVEFGEALRLLADKAGISLKPREGRERAAAEESDGLFEINEAATEYYHHLLLSAKAGEAARSYVARRGLTPETVKVFRLGFSPDSWDAMKGHLLGKGYTEKMIMGAGLTVEKEGGGSYDRFRDRLMFPICDVQGRVAGFGARALDDSLPKYMNSPQTLVFDKSSILYGIDKARSAIRKRGSVIIVEGYTDAITAYQNGWQNVVASMGTSLTGKQVGSLKGLTNNIILALDADLAGEEATLRGRAVLAHSNAEAEVILLPSGKDPDEVIGENPALWEKLVEKAMPVMDFAFQSVLGKIDVDRARDKSLAIQKLVPLIYEMSDLTQRFHYVDKLARSLKMGRSDVEAVLHRSRMVDKKPRAVKPVEQLSPPRLVSSPIEEHCLALLLKYPELGPLAGELSSEHFQYTENREVFDGWRHSPDVSMLQSRLDDSLTEHLCYLVDRAFPPGIGEDERKRRSELEYCILRLSERATRRSEAEKEAMLEAAREKGGVESELTKLEEQGIGSGQQLQEVFIKKGEKKWIQPRERT